MAQTSVFKGNNRSILRCEDNTAYILHSTAIVRVYDDGRIALNSGGWVTATTKTAMNQVSNQYCLGFRVSQVKGEWVVSHMGSELAFRDGLILSQSEFVNEEKQVCTG